MVAEKQKMKEVLNSVLTVEFMELEEIAKIYHQKNINLETLIQMN